MNSASTRKPPNDCGCCKGNTAATPVRIENRPGLSTVVYRTGDYNNFKDSMLARLSSPDLPPLHRLSTRNADDYSIALIDAWSCVSDVLCFYQEYFANEGLLRTAKERLSVLEHARLIGYQLNPGVAASTFLAFTMDEPIKGTDNPITETTILAGSKVQSTPGPDETAQLFETEINIQARVDWNAIRPRMVQPQTINSSMESVVIDGITTFVKPGDELLLINESDSKYIRKVTELLIDETNKTTQLKLSGDSPSPSYYSALPLDSQIAFSYFDSNSVVDDDVINCFINHSWAIEDIIAIADAKHWNLDEISQRINTHDDILENISSGKGVFGFHNRANLFGYNAMKKVQYSDESPYHPLDISKWDEWTSDETSGQMFLNNAYTEILPDSYIILKADRWIFDRTTGDTITSPEFINEEIDPQNIFKIAGRGYIFLKSQSVYKVNSIKSLTRTAYGISGKSTQILLEDGKTWESFRDDPFSIIRKAEVSVQSEALPLTQVPINEKISGNRILLERADLYLRNEQYVSVSGERYDQPGVITNEVLQIKQVRLEHGFTQLIFTTVLRHKYVRNTVKINANVAPASHGESVSEILGSGNAGIASQRFSLKQTPLTYTSADVPSGSASSLKIRVNNVLWHEVETFLDHTGDEKVYTTKLDDAGIPHVYFGSGVEGARLPSGNNNVIAHYRKGIGLGGLVKAKQLNLLLTRPLGVKDVVNPVQSSGADNPETLINARINAPLGLLTLDRAVSLSDYEDFSRAFAGISKARAVAISQQGISGIYISVAGPNGAILDPLGKTYNNLLSALQRSGDPYTNFSILSYRPAYFKFDAGLYVHSNYQSDLVLKTARKAMRDAFSFEARSFNQPIHLSEVIHILQQVAGVIAVDVNYLYRSDSDPVAPPPRSIMPMLSTTGITVSGAELITLDPAPLDQLRVKA